MGGQACDHTRDMESNQGILCVVQTSFKQYRMIAALAAFLILTLSIVATLYETAAFASYASSVGATFSSYSIWQLAYKSHFSTEKTTQSCFGIDLLSYNPVIDPTTASYILYSHLELLSYNQSSRRKNKCRHWVDRRNGGNGQVVACYVRVSSSHQANEGFSVDAQTEKLRKMVEKYNPSEIHWFIDPGMTGTRFDNRAVVDIMELRKQGKIAELWVSEIDRIGRDAPKLIMFFFNFCEDGGKIRTPEAVYDNSQDLGAFIVLTVKAFAAQDSNQARSKASIAGKAESFKQKHWNKRVPFGYTRAGRWIQKVPSCEEAIWEISDLFLILEDEVKVAEQINIKYGTTLETRLKRSHIQTILSDPVYVGRPEHLGVIFEDLSLAFVNEEMFSKCQDIIDKRKQKQESKPLDALQEMLVIKHMWAIRFIEKEIVFVHRGCGGKVDKNGAFRYDDVRQQLFICHKCKEQWRVPSMSQLAEEKKGLLDDARDLLQEVNEKKKRDKLLSKREWDQKYNRSQSFEDFFWRNDGPARTTGPDFGILFGWLFQ